MNRAERVERVVNSHQEVLQQFIRRIAGIRRTFSLHPQIPTLQQLSEDVSALILNVQRLEPIADVNIYNTTLATAKELQEEILQHLEISSIDAFEEVVPVSTQEQQQEQLEQEQEENPETNKRLKIDKSKLEHFLSLGFTVRRIAEDGLLGKVLHHNTIYNFMKKQGISSIRERYTSLADEEIIELIREINHSFPNSGIREVVAHLKRRNPPVLLQRDRCQRLLAEIDPAGTASRWAQVVKRRQYSVPTPNSLWHIDSNHALVRWGFVVFGQIDGFSRLVSQLHLSTDNKASSALVTFIKSVKNYGVPSRIRLDKGSEFNHVEYLMNRLNGENRGSVLRGRSVHNQRIERLWRDVFTKVLMKFYNIFNHMESHDILDILNPIHMFSLQYVFAPRLQIALEQWSFAHNYHQIRTENNQSPLQLWTAASLHSREQNSTAMNNLFRRDIDGINRQIEDILDRYHLQEPNDIKVTVPRYEAPLTPEQLEELKNGVDPLQASNSDGVDVYGSVVQFIENCRRL